MKVQHIETEIEGRKVVRVRLFYPDFPAGAYREFESILDAMFFHVFKRLGLPSHSHGRDSKIQIPASFKTGLDIDVACLSRCRNSKYLTQFPEDWLLKLYVYTGVPIDELLMIADYKHLAAHPKRLNLISEFAVKANAYDKIASDIRTAQPTAETLSKVVDVVMGVERTIREQK